MQPLRFLFLFALALSACAPSTPGPTLAPASPSPTGPSLPATLTPLPPAQPSATPTIFPYQQFPLAPEDQAAYRQALVDIPRYRQGELALRLQDTSGNPLPGYRIRYRQVSHDFLFGGLAEPYQSGLLRSGGFNTMIAYMDWRWLEPAQDRFTLDFAGYWLGIDELHSAGIFLRTNNLFGMSDDMPPYYRDLPYDQFLQRLYAHVSETVRRFGPSVDSWEAILEPNFGNHNPLKLTRDQYYQAISTSIRAVRDNDPGALVEISLSYPCGGIDWLDNFQIVQDMLDRQLDFDAIGLQFYYNSLTIDGVSHPRRSLAALSECYDRYQAMLAPAGKRIVGSEFSVTSTSQPRQPGYWGEPWTEDSQAQYLVNAWTIFFSKPGNLGLVWWNTVEPSSFIADGGLLHEDGSPKKAWLALQDLLRSWTTTGEGQTGPQGDFLLRGFGGDYELEIIDPAGGSRLLQRVHVQEQQSGGETILFDPASRLQEQAARLEDLAGYWAALPDEQQARKANDFLALVQHHLQAGEWALAGQTLAAALPELAITRQVSVPVEELLPANQDGSGPWIENGSNLIWGATALHFPYDFPAGQVTIEIQAHAHNESGESPRMVAGAGGQYSPVWTVSSESPQLFRFSVPTTGAEEVLTIRFPYDERIYERIRAQGGIDGELKLYIDQVKMIIQSEEAP